MIQLTPTSTYPVVYRAPNGEEGLTIVGKVYTPPNFTAVISETLTELEDGLYYLVVNFSAEGIYIVHIEEEVETYKISKSFR